MATSSSGGGQDNFGNSSNNNRGGEGSGGDRSRSNPAPYGYNHLGQPVSKAERDAWNARKASTGLNSADLFASLTGGGDAGFDPFAQMMAMMGAGPSGPSAAELQAEADAREEERLKTVGLNDRDALYGDYTSAAETATSYINNLVQQERSNAALMGVDYTLTDEMKQARTENYFADIWSSSDQESLQGLYDKWGYMDGMDESSAWVLKRGVGTGDTDETETDPAKVTSIKGQGGGTLATQGLLVEDESPNQTSLLGG